MEKQEEHYEDEIELMDILNVVWKRKWLIIIPTFIIVILAAVYSLILPKLWEVDAIIEPSKFLVRTEQGNFNEIYVADAKSLTGQINHKAYNQLIAAELNIDLQKFPKIEAQNLRDTKLIQVKIKSGDVNEAKSILISLFKHMKRDLDKKIDVEIKSIDTKVEVQENLIKQKNFNITDKKSEIIVLQIEKNKLQEEILSLKNKLKISKERAESLLQEMKSVKKRIDKIEEQQRAALSEKQNEMNTLSLLLYSNEVQHNLQYYNTLDESLTNEKLTQENLDLQTKGRKDDIKKLDTEIDKKKTKIDGINNDIENVKNQIKLFQEEKARIDYAKLIKAPTSSINAGFLSLFIFTMLAFFLDYIKKNKILR